MFSILAIALPLLAADAPKVPVLVELFTSQGCSSCPPADRVLARLESQQPVRNAEIIVLSEHVDYWNQLGWKDPFSSHRYTERQQQYGLIFGKNGVYTPQMVIDGRVAFVGSDEARAKREVARAASGEFTPASVTIALREIDRKNVAVFALTVENLPRSNGDDAPQVWLAITESGIQIPVKAGENGGHTLSHVGVVRTLIAAPEMKRNASHYTATAKAELQPDWDRKQLKAVLFVQEKNGKRVLGAASIPVAVN
jgi:hypothetical protein